jgi:flagellar hook-basal body complex protein FliE
MVKSAIEQVNGAQQKAQALARAFELGDPNVRLSDVMVSLQKANLSFQAITQVRNKLVTAYQEIMNMPV